jgi:hypothetical protein
MLRLSLTNVHTGILEGDEHVDIVGLGTNGRNDRGLVVSQEILEVIKKKRPTFRRYFCSGVKSVNPVASWVFQAS